MSTLQLGLCRGSRAEKTSMLLKKYQSSSSSTLDEINKSDHSPEKRRCSLDIQSRMMTLQEAFSNPKFAQDRREKPVKKSDPNYGKPQEGTHAAERGKKAHKHVHKEILELCEIVYMHGIESGEYTVILFGDLFRLYTHISDKVVGILLRAKKHGLIDFEPEILFQGQNDDTPIFLIKQMEDIYLEYNTNKNFS